MIFVLDILGGSKPVLSSTGIVCLVYTLYGLTAEEIAIVEGNT